MAGTVYEWDTNRAIPGLKNPIDLVGQRESTGRAMAVQRAS